MLEEFIENSKHLNLYGVVVLQNGEKIDEHHWNPEKRRNQYSITKSFTSTAVGIAVEEGLISLQDKVIDYFKNHIPKNLPQQQLERLEKLTIEHLLMMTVGYEDSYLMLGDSKDSDWIKVCLTSPLIYEPKERFIYTSYTSYLVSVILEKLTGYSLIDYLMPRLFEPLGIERPDCELTPSGHVYGATGLMLTVNELSKFGQLYLQEGVYNGKQILSKKWVEEATKKQIDTYTGIKDDCMGYGYFFWRGKHSSYRASGMLGQSCTILKNKNAVIAINSNEKNSQEIRECIWEYIYPML
ncbi:serine hydrolase domain-containing protein [Clostridium subterminale]|uniref:Serine hydrolase domain-containing protein n=1 Tax=Clostridium subterminale TaxID=1550 RepID=A0ABP3VSJ7_CLOSU